MLRCNQIPSDAITGDVMTMSGRRDELGRFLRDRRSRVKPTDVGLPSGPNRRVAGLRREEVATLAGVGVSWYTMLENGTAVGASTETLLAIARALRLRDDERDYLLRIAENRIAQTPRDVASSLALGALDAIVGAPAYVCSSYWRVLAWNRATTVVWGVEPPGGATFNIVARMFGDPKLRAMHGERFAGFARGLVGMVRGAAAAHAEDGEYRAMCDELRLDPLFAAAWDGYEIAAPMGSPEVVVASVAVGEFTYRPLTLELPGVDEHFIVVQVPDEASASRLRSALDDRISD